MAPTIHHRGFLALTLWTPVERVIQQPVAAQIGAALTGLGLALLDMRIFFGMLVLLLVTEWLDFRLGIERAHREDTYRDDLARVGRLTKLGGLVLLLTARGMEELVMAAIAHAGHPEINTLGAISTAAVVSTWRYEVESADRHLQALSGRGIPVLTHALQAFRAVEDVILRIFVPRLPAPPPPPTPAPEERAS